MGEDVVGVLGVGGEEGHRVSHTSLHAMSQVIVVLYDSHMQVLLVRLLYLFAKTGFKPVATDDNISPFLAFVA